MPTTRTVRIIVSASVVAEITDVSTPASGASAITTTTRKDVISYNRTFQTGTGSSQFDRAAKKVVSLAAAAQDLDVSGATFTTPDGTAWTAASLGIIAVKNNATTTGYGVDIGGDTNSVPLFGAAADFINLGPDGFLLWVDPIDGIAVTAGTGDIIQIDPGANTIEAEIFVAGQSA